MADGMMIDAMGVTIGHHCRSFQSTQKSQSPANNSRVMSAAAATANAAVRKKKKSHLRSMNSSLRVSRPRSSCWRARVAVGTSTDWRTVPLLFAIGTFLLDAQEANHGLHPYREDSKRQLGIGDEGPVERCGEDLLGNPQAMAPFVQPNLHHLGDACGDQQEERPG